MGYVVNGQSPPEEQPRWEGDRGQGWVVLQALLLLLWLVAPRVGPAWRGSWRQVGVWFGLLVAATGGLLALAGASALGRQLTPFPRPTVRGQLISGGPYRLVRHPIYSGIILGAAGLALATANLSRLAVAGLLVVFFRAKSTREEQWLSQTYPEYATYQRRVGRLWPRWR